MSEKVVVRLTRPQERALRVIDRMERSGEPGHNAEGDLSVCSRNWPATHASLVRRGLVDVQYEPGPSEDDDPWLYRLTPKGRSALSGSDQ